MIYLVEFLLFLAPFAGFALWRKLNPGREVPATVVGLLLLGILCGIAAAFWYGHSVSLRPGTVYVPATLGPNGQVVPGRAVPKP